MNRTLLWLGPRFARLMLTVSLALYVASLVSGDRPLGVLGAFVMAIGATWELGRESLRRELYEMVSNRVKRADH